MIVRVETAARLHFGVLDLRGSAGRWFGGIGTAAPGPLLQVAVHTGDGEGPDGPDRLVVEGPDAERACRYALRFLDAYGLPRRGRIVVERALPSHSGLGSGTQLALAVARGLAEVHGIDADVPTLARVVGRARRSAVGTWTFADGGLVLDGGHRRGPSEGAAGVAAGGAAGAGNAVSDDGADPDGTRPRAMGPGPGDVAPLLARIPFPPSWRCIVAVPASGGSMTGQAEQAAFDILPEPPDREVERVAHLVLTALLPSVATDDIETFGTALTEIQHVTGNWWAAAQGGPFAASSRGLVERLRAAGAAGVGQSSWGPTVYGVTDDPAVATSIANALRAALAGGGTVHEGPFRPTGARVWREEPTATG
jgi:predicted sugar kinase